MEFAASALSSLGAGAAAAATSSFVPSAGTAASILSGGSTVLSALNSARAGQVKADALNAQAFDSDTQAGISQVQGISRQTTLKQALVDTLGKRDVATAASGVDLSFGTAAVSRRQSVTDFESQSSIDQDTTDEQVARLRERAANLRIQAKQAQAGGLGTAAAQAVEGAAKLFKRG